jgi:Tfp pilus assembly protein PilV
MLVHDRRHASPRRENSRDPAFAASPQAGLTILEVLIAMGVLVIAALTVATTTTSSFSAVDQSESTIRLENAVRETMESIRAVPFADLDGLDGNQLYTNDPKKNILIAVSVSQTSSTMKAVVIEAFEKKRSGNLVVRGEKIFQTLTYRSER